MSQAREKHWHGSNQGVVTGVFPFPGYESDLTRKTSSKGSDSSQSNSPVSGRSVLLLPSSTTSMYPLEMTGEGLEPRNAERLAAASTASAHPPPASYSVCHAERPDTRDNGKKVAAARPEEFVKTEIFIDHPLDGAAGKLVQRREEEKVKREKKEEEEKEEEGEQRDLSLESITTTNGAIVTSGDATRSWSESRPMVTQPDFQIGTRSTPASQHLPIHPVILDPCKGESCSSVEVANKTDEEKLTSISPMSDEDKLTAIFLCTDSDIPPSGPSEPAAALESISKKEPDERVPLSPDNHLDECCESVTPAAKKDIWARREMGNGSSAASNEEAHQGVSLPPAHSLPPPLETEKDLAEKQDGSVEEEEEGGDDDSIEFPAASGDTSTPPPDAVEEKKEDCDYEEEEEVASAGEVEPPFSDEGLQSPASSAKTSGQPQLDTENVTSLQVEWTKEEEEGADLMLTPFGRGLVQDDAGRPMAQPQRALARSEDPQVILKVTNVSF